MYSLAHLAGRQLLPNVLASLALGRRKLLRRNVVLHTAHPTESLNPASRLFELLAQDHSDRSTAERIMIETDEVLQSVVGELLELFDEFSGERWILHATGGNKMMSAAMLLLGADPRVHAVIYRDIRAGWRRVRLGASVSDAREDPIDPEDPVLGGLMDQEVTLELLPLAEVIRAQFAEAGSVKDFRHQAVPRHLDPVRWLDHVATRHQARFAGFQGWPQGPASEGAAFECWLARTLQVAGATQVIWNCKGRDPARNLVMETDVIAVRGNRIAVYDVKLEKPDVSGKSEQIRAARGTADALGGLAASAVMVRPNWPATPHIERFAEALGVDLIHRQRMQGLLTRICRPLGLEVAPEADTRLQQIAATLLRLHQQPARKWVLFAH